MNINELRAEVLRRQKSANAKIARLERKGVAISGTVHDVRRSTGNVKRYNSRQLNTYLSELNDFMRRPNQFVAGNEGVPIRAGVWKNFEKIQNEYVSFVTEHYNTVKDTFVPRHGMTVGDTDKKMRPKRERGKGGVPRPLENFSPIQLSGVMSEEKLRELQTQFSKKLNPDFVPKLVQKQKFQMLQAVQSFGDPVINQMAAELTLHQVDTLWNYTDAPRDLFASYRVQQLLAKNPDDEQAALTLDDDRFEVMEWLKWAKNLPPRA